MTKSAVSTSGAFTAFLIWLAVCTCVQAQNPSTVGEFDPSVEVRVELTRNVRLDFMFGREKSEELPSGKVKLDVGMTFRLRPILKRLFNVSNSDKRHRLVFGANYDYARAKEAGVVITEHTLMLDATLRHAFGNRFLLSDRNRLEFRWVNGAFRFRYRNRLRLERPVRIWKKEVTPHVGAEAFWDSRVRRFNQYRYRAGVEVPLRGPFLFDLGYERQRCATCSNVNVNVVEAALIITFRRRN